jgi:hypothetical protein
MANRWLAAALLLASVMVAGIATANPAPTALTASDTLMLMLGPDEGVSLIPAACCKTCSKGKACGDSCISRDKQCHKGVGCACDG